jgi:hypothetical protein
MVSNAFESSTSWRVRGSTETQFWIKKSALSLRLPAIVPPWFDPPSLALVGVINAAPWDCPGDGPVPAPFSVTKPVRFDNSSLIVVLRATVAGGYEKRRQQYASSNSTNFSNKKEEL